MLAEERGAPTVVEFALLKARPDTADALCAGLAAGRAVLARAPGYLAVSSTGASRIPQSVVLRVEWESLDAHMRGFRENLRFYAEWRSHFYHLLAETPTVTHYLAFAGP